MESSSERERCTRTDAFHPALDNRVECHVIATYQYCLNLHPMFRRHPTSYFLRITPHVEFYNPPLLDQSREVNRPILYFSDRQPQQRQQRIVQFIRIAHDRPGLPLHLLDRRRVQRSNFSCQLSWKRAPHLHRTRPPLFQWRVVEKRIGIRIQDLVRERRRQRRIDRHTANGAGFDLLEKDSQPVEVHRLSETVTQGLVHERMIRHPACSFTNHIVLTGQRVGEDGPKQIFCLHPLDLRRDFFAMGETQQHQRATDIPAPARHKHRRLQYGGKQDLAKRMAVQEPEHRLERKTVFLSERDHNPVVCRRGLQFEIKGHTESLPQGEAPGTVDPASKWRVQDQLHPAALIEEPLRHNRLLRRHGSEHRLACQYILYNLLCTSLIQSALLLKPAKR